MTYNEHFLITAIIITINTDLFKFYTAAGVSHLTC